MKNYDEMYQSVLSKYDEYLEKKKKKRTVIIKRTTAAVFGTAAVLGIGLTTYVLRPPKKPTPNQSGIIAETETTSAETTTAPTSSSTAAPQIVTTEQTTVITALTTVSSALSTTATVHTTATATTPSVTYTQPVTEPPVVTTEEPPTTTVIANIKEIKFGYADESDIGGHHNASLPQKIIMKCMSFCELGETLTVDVAMADATLRPYLYDTATDYEYRIYACDPRNHEDIADGNFVVNEQNKVYKQNYPSDEAAMFDINGDENNYDLYHQETAIIDFSNYKAGDSGCIAFAFLAVYAEDPLHPSYMGSIQYMHFYVGEKGTSISNLSIEDAIENYQAVTMS